MKRYWIGVASHEHVRKAVAGGFCQFSHGSGAAAGRLQPGDGIAYYSPRSHVRSGHPVQAFTAIGIICGGDPEQASDSGALHATRCKVDYVRAKEAPIKPLLDQFSFTRERAHWGQAFRRGLLSIESADFALIAKAMNAGKIVVVD